MKLSMASSIAVVSAAICGVYGAITESPSCAPVSTPSPAGDYVYYACMTESSTSRTLNLASLSNGTAMTPKLCASFCSSKGFPLMGLEFGDECYCGTYPTGDSTTAAQVDCNQECVGDKTQLCGGADRLDVYALKNYTFPTIPRTAGGYIYIGCYTDNTNARALGSASLVDYNAMTVEKCAAFCSGQSYFMFGVEFAGECWCGNTVAGNNAVAPNQDAECSSTCPGDDTELACGAANRLSTYQKTAPWEL